MNKEDEISLKGSMLAGHDDNLRGKYTVEKEDDRGHQQQVSGAFGDSSNVDEETIRKILQQ